MNCKFPRFCCGAMKLGFVLVSAAFLEQLQAAPQVLGAGVDLGSSSPWAARGSFQHPDSDHTSGCTYPEVKSTHSSPFSHQGWDLNWNSYGSISQQDLVDLFVCFRNFFPYEKNMSHCNHTLQKKRILEYFRCRQRRTAVNAEERENEARI